MKRFLLLFLIPFLFSCNSVSENKEKYQFDLILDMRGFPPSSVTENLVYLFAISGNDNFSKYNDRLEHNSPDYDISYDIIVDYVECNSYKKGTYTISNEAAYMDWFVLVRNADTGSLTGFRGDADITDRFLFESGKTYICRGGRYLEEIDPSDFNPEKNMISENTDDTSEITFFKDEIYNSVFKNLDTYSIKRTESTYYFGEDNIFFIYEQEFKYDEDNKIIEIADLIFPPSHERTEDFHINYLGFEYNNDDILKTVKYYDINQPDPFLYYDLNYTENDFTVLKNELIEGEWVQELYYNDLPLQFQTIIIFNPVSSYRVYLFHHKYLANNLLCFDTNFFLFSNNYNILERDNNLPVLVRIENEEYIDALEMEYNKMGIDNINYYKEDMLFGYVIFTYNEQDLVSKINIYDNKDKLLSEHIYEWEERKSNFRLYFNYKYF